jgi:hypothetical protein
MELRSRVFFFASFVMVAEDEWWRRVLQALGKSVGLQLSMAEFLNGSLIEPALSTGRRGHSAPGCQVRLGLFFLRAREPPWRIFTDSTTTFYIYLTPSGIVSGSQVDGRALTSAVCRT